MKAPGIQSFFDPDNLRKLLNRKLLDGSNPLFDKAVFRLFDSINELGKELSPAIIKDIIYAKMIDYLMEIIPGYESAQPLLGSIEEEAALIAYKRKRFLEVAKPCDVLLVRGNQRVSRMIQTLTQSPYSHAAFYRGKGELIEADPEGVLLCPIDKYIHLDLRICRPVMLGPRGKRVVMRHMEHMLKTQPQYNLENIEKLFFKYWYSKFRPDTKLYIGGDTKFENYYICSGMIAHGFQKAHYPITPSLRFRKPKGRTKVRKIRSVQDYVELISHLKKHYSHIVPGDFDHSPFFASIKFLYLDTKYNVPKRKFLMEHEDDPNWEGAESQEMV
ncbi:MAG: hypothetical protein COB67_04990 [SAR324 cluster bacterium]|uniref:Uncharacterized protein n=1 Tax=SAR324 cluster bacterium TaxID=2024889 RepID=A0A2A4T6L9_9DELT|nr:MAG: hypothetical protein COB67_04990 [SAR324 cluster bacterium]